MDQLFDFVQTLKNTTNRHIIDGVEVMIFGVAVMMLFCRDLHRFLMKSWNDARRACVHVYILCVIKLTTSHRKCIDSAGTCVLSEMNELKYRNLGRVNESIYSWYSRDLDVILSWSRLQWLMEENIKRTWRQKRYRERKQHVISWKKSENEVHVHVSRPITISERNRT